MRTQVTNMTAYWWRRDVKDFGHQTLIRWLASASPCMRSGADPILQRASALSATKRVMDIPCCGPAPVCPRGLRCRQVGCTSRATAHMKPASSWHMMVVGRLAVSFPRLFLHSWLVRAHRTAKRRPCRWKSKPIGLPRLRLRYGETARSPTAR